MVTILRETCSAIMHTRCHGQCWSTSIRTVGDTNFDILVGTPSFRFSRMRDPGSESTFRVTLSIFRLGELTQVHTLQVSFVGGGRGGASFGLFVSLELCIP